LTDEGWRRGTYGRHVQNDSWVGKLKYIENYQYPLVKIGNHIWTRENFSGNIPHGKDADHRYGINVVKGNAYYSLMAINNMKTPTGYHVAKSNDYENLKKIVTFNVGSEGIGGVMQKGGNSGFDMEWNGWYIYHFYHLDNYVLDEYYFWDYKLQAGNGAHHMTYLTGDGCTCGVKDDVMGVSKKLNGETYAMQIRLVMD